MVNHFIGAEQNRYSANSADPDETTAHNEPLECFLIWIFTVRHFVIDFLSEIYICNNVCVRIQRWKSTFQKRTGDRVYSHAFLCTTGSGLGFFCSADLNISLEG